MNLKQNYLTQSGCYKAEKRITVKGLMIHSVGCPQPKADVFMKNWNRADANACVHAIVEPDGDVYQLAPVGFPGLALRRRRKQYPYRCGNDGACHHQIYGRLKLDGDRGGGEYEEPCACHLQICSGIVCTSLSAVPFGPTCGWRGDFPFRGM